MGQKVPGPPSDSPPWNLKKVQPLENTPLQNGIIVM